MYEKIKPVTVNGVILIIMFAFTAVGLLSLTEKRVLSRKN